MFNNPNNPSQGNNMQNNSLLNNSLSGFGKPNTNLGNNNSLLGGSGFGQTTQGGLLSNTTNTGGFGSGGGLTSNINTTNTGGGGFGSQNTNQQQSSNIFGNFGFPSKTQTSNLNTGSNSSNILGNAGSNTGTFGFNGIASSTNTGGTFGSNSGFGGSTNTAAGGNIGSGFGGSTNTAAGGNIGSGFGGSTNTAAGGNIGSGFGAQTNTGSNLTSGFGLSTANKSNVTSGFGMATNTTNNTFSSGFATTTGLNSSFGGGAATTNTIGGGGGGGGFGATTTNTSGFGTTNTNSSGFGASSNLNTGFGGSNFNTARSGSGGGGFGFNNPTTSSFGGSGGGFSVGANATNTTGFSNASSGFGATTKPSGGFSSNINTGGGFGMTNTNTNAPNVSSSGFGVTNVNSQINNMKQPFILGTSKIFKLNLSQIPNANNDYEFPEPPSDSISSLKFSPIEDFVAATAWDGTVSIYGVDMDAQKVVPKSRKKIPGCALKANWDSSGSKLYLACTDSTAKIWDLERDEIISVVNHSQPVCSVNPVMNNQRDSYLLTTSWDKVIKYTDLRTKQMIKTFTLPYKIFDSDYMFPYAAAITSSKTVYTYKLTGSSFSEYRKIDSSLKVNNRCVTCFPEKHGKNCTGFLTGTISGRVTVTYFQQSSSYYHNRSSQSDYCFRCNQPESPTDSSINLYPVNSISFHPTYRTIVCGGSDGILYFNDIENKKKLGALNQSSLPITATAVNRSGSALVYAIGYDWSRGYEYYDRANMKPEIYVRLSKEFMPKSGR